MVLSKSKMVTQDQACVGRNVAIATAELHFLSNRPLKSTVPEGMEQALFGMGCFWGAERLFWQINGVWLSMVGYAGGFTPNATYEEVCSGMSGHNEVVRLVFDPRKLGYEELLCQFWQGHNPTQGMAQGNDRGTQYRSGIYCYGADQLAAALSSRDEYGPELAAAGYGDISTEIMPAPEFYYAEDYHQQYLAKNPAGYCGIGGTGVRCAVGEGME